MPLPPKFMFAEAKVLMISLPLIFKWARWPDERSGRTRHKGKYLTDGVDVSPSFGWHSSVLRLLHVSAREGARTRNFGMSSKCRTLSQVGRARCGTDTLRPPQPYSYRENWGSERE